MSFLSKLLSNKRAIARARGGNQTKRQSNSLTDKTVTTLQSLKKGLKGWLHTKFNYIEHIYQTAPIIS